MCMECLAPFVNLLNFMYDTGCIDIFFMLHVHVCTYGVLRYTFMYDGGMTVSTENGQFFEVHVIEKEFIETMCML